VQLLLVLYVLSQAPAPASSNLPVRADRFQLVVPQGWKILYEGTYVLLEHLSGASLLVERVDRISNMREYAMRQAERIMAPLGFAKLGDPRDFKDIHDEWIQYEIRGNRLADHRRILYRVLRRDTAFFEFVYEAREDSFETLLTDAEAIASSVQALIEARPRVGRTRRSPR
jgi:hypothetical protein